jgi:dihydrofolate reductase
MKTVVIAVISLDGCITRHDVPGAQGWASPEDQAHFRSACAPCDVRIFGSGTYIPDRESMRGSARPGVRRIILTSDPERFHDDAIPGQLEFTAEAPHALVARLAGEGHLRCAVLGGGKVYGSFLQSGLVDEIELSVEPVVFGSGTRFAGSEPIEQNFRFVSIDKLNESTLLLRYARL